MGCNETINAIRVADIPLDKAKKTPPKYNPWNNNPLIDASLNALKEIYLSFEKKMKNRKGWLIYNITEEGYSKIIWR